MKDLAEKTTPVFLLAALGLFLLLAGHAFAATPVFINEIHYDNIGTDTGEAVEIFGPAGTDLSGWTLVRYNGATTSNGVVYGSDTLNGTLPDLGGGYGVLVIQFATNGLQNGPSDGIALVDDSDQVVQFLSYEGTLTAVEGPANGMTSSDIGVAELGADPAGSSLQLCGRGTDYEDFSWSAPSPATFGAINNCQCLSAAAAAELLLTEVKVTPTGEEFIEIYNPGGFSIDLSNVYLTDATFAEGGTYYYNIVTGVNAGGGGFSDFHARFPDCAKIPPGAYQTVALAGSEAFSAAFGTDPTYELFEDGSSADSIPDMREALPGLINGQGGLTNDGEMLILYYWDGESDLVVDLDYVVWGDKAEAVDKSGIAIDGPDADSDASTYLNDTIILSQDVLASAAHNATTSWQRADLTEGLETKSGGNGFGGNDETSEDLGDTWCENTPTPNAPSNCKMICGAPATFIHEIQGSGAASPLAGSMVVIEGVVVGDFQESAHVLGFFVQEEDAEADADPSTSEGIFVYDDGFGVATAPGDVVRVAGTVEESSGLTRLRNITDVVVCASGATVTPAVVTLPFPDAGFPERYEGMSVTLPQDLTVTDTYDLARYGEVLLSYGGRLPEPTAVVAPGAAAVALEAQNNLNRILLDDTSDQQNPDPIVYPPPSLSAANTLRGGDTVQIPSGVFSYKYDAYRIRPTAPVGVTHVNPRPDAPPDTGGRIKIASFSLSNYFTTIDTGSFICGPFGGMACRGADSAEEFERQRAKILAALAALDPDILALTEIENNPTAAIQDLVDGLNDITGPGTYAFIDTGIVGTDAVRNALVYKPASVSPVGLHAVLDSSVDPDFLDDYNRPSIAQTFVEPTSGDKFTVAVNHFKAKGSPCDAVGDPDLGDGQSNCNLTRFKAATALVNWLAGDPTGSSDPDFLILGDLNTYAMEDPINTLEAAGYIDLIQNFIGTSAYGFCYDGQWSYLEHALAGATFAPKVTGAAIWHINADEPRALDYNEEYKSPGQLGSLYNGDPFRSADHDPVLVGFDPDDGDGVDPEVEDNAPNQGDGNGDMIPDSQQSNVTSAPGPTGDYVTVEVSGNCSVIAAATPAAESDASTADPVYEYPLGLMRLEIPCERADVRVIYHGAGSGLLYVYRNFGPTPPAYGTPKWYAHPGVSLGFEPIGTESALAARFTLVNGQLGDDTDASDNRILSLGGPAVALPAARPVPALGGCGLGLLMLGMLALALLGMLSRRRSKAQP